MGADGLPKKLRYRAGDTIPAETVAEILSDYDAMPRIENQKGSKTSRLGRPVDGEFQKILDRYGVTRAHVTAILNRRRRHPRRKVRQFVVGRTILGDKSSAGRCDRCACMICDRFLDCPVYPNGTRCNSFCGAKHYEKKPLDVPPKMAGRVRDESEAMVAAKKVCSHFVPQRSIRQDGMRSDMPSSFVKWETLHGHPASSIGQGGAWQGVGLRKNLAALERRSKKNQPPVRWIMRDGKPVDEEEAA